MYKIVLIKVLMLTILCHGMGSDLQIQNIRVVNRPDVEGNPVSVLFDLQWQNAWKTERNNDAVWVFLKFNGYWNNHVKLIPDGHDIVKYRGESEQAQLEIDVASDSTGFFIYPTSSFRGDIDVKLQILIDTVQNTSWNRLRGLLVHGLEMVYIPQGQFTVGSPDEAAISRATLYRSDAVGESGGLYTITSEEEIIVGPNAGQLYYWSEEPLYNGDQKGPIPAQFPKGYDAFYIMKYEVSQGQYASFLNSIPDNWTYLRAPFSGRGYYKKRGTIEFDGEKYLAKSPNRPMNYISFTDGLAFTDWAALRPITELEYEKAARGPGIPKPAEFVWGTDSYDELERYVDADGELRFSEGIHEGLLADEMRPVFGASYYWVMDLSGSLWEKVITIGNPIGRSFQGTHGDGVLDFGHATNDDWPTSDNEVGGFGYRGGGYYEVGTFYSDFNPHSPIGYRYYGAWSGGPRYISYGYRAGRSAK